MHFSVKLAKINILVGGNIALNKVSGLWLTALVIITSLHQCLAQIPVASFGISQSSGCTPLTVSFNNTSTNAASYHWDFGNGVVSVLHSPVITFTTPGDFFVKLIATNASGSDSIISSQPIHIENKPVVQFSLNKSSACQGEVVNFTNQSAVYDSCQWDFGDGVTSNQTNPTHIYATAGTYNVTLVLFRLNSSCTQTLTKNNIVVIKPVPVVTATVDTFSTCNINKIFLFHASANTTSTYQWNFGDGGIATGLNVQHQYSQPGNFQVAVTATASGCSSTVNLASPVTVLNNPIPVITSNITSGCNPLTVVLSTNAIGASSIQWSLGNGQTSTLSTVGVLYNNAGNYNPYLTATYPNGCSSQSAPLTIHALQSPVSTFTTSNTTGCKPLNISFQTNACSGCSYQWNFGDGNSSSLFNGNNTYTQSGIFYPTLTVTAANGCTATSNLPYGITVNGPEAGFLADKVTGCNPLTVNFANTSIGSTSWLWKFGTGDTSTANSPTYLYQNQGSFNVTLIVFDGNGCKDSLRKQGYINPGPSVNNFSNPQPVSGCAPLTVSLSDSSGANSWLWNFGDGSTGTAQNVSHTYNTPGTYTVSLQTQSNGSTCSQTISNFATYIVGGGIADFTYNQTLCPPFIGTFTDSSLNAVSWQWNFGDGQTSTQQNPVHTYNHTGSYNVSLTITSANGCTSTKVEQYAMNFLNLGAAPSAHTLDTIPPLDVQFSANSVGATSWLWTFGDGDSSTQENPMHTYQSTGPFTISLTIANDSCSYTYSFPPTNFGSGGTFYDENHDTTQFTMHYDGCAPLTISFNNPFLNVVGSHWDFGDGNTSSQQNPVHTYNVPGIYDVMLIANLSNASVDTIYHSQAVKVAGTPVTFTVNSVNTCNGSNIQALPSNPNLQSYNWDFGDNQTSTQVSPVHSYANTSNYIISLQAQDTSGCTVIHSKSLYANADANAILSNKNRACASDTITFSVQNTNYVNYTWDFGDGTSATGNPISHIYSDSGTYSVQVVITDINACTQTINAVQPINIVKPVADFSINMLSSSCTMVNVQLTNTSTGSTSYTWDLGDGTMSSSTDVNKYYYYGPNPPYTYDIKLTAYNNGCLSTKTLAQAVTIPNFDVKFSYTRSQGCLPITINVTDSSLNAVSWKWSWGDGDTTFTQASQHTFTTVPQDKIKLFAKDVNGCEKNYELDNIQLPAAVFMQSDTIGCNPKQIQFTDSSKNAYQWLWKFGNGSTSTVQNPGVNYNSTGNFTPTLIITDSFGCKDTVDGKTIAITEPQADFSYTKSAGCIPVIVQFQNASSGATNYLWNFGDGSTSTLQNPNHIYTTVGNYQVTLTVTDASGCSNTKTLTNALHIPGPLASFSLSNNYGCQPLTISLNDSSQNALSHFWSFGDGDTSVNASPTHTFTTAGSYLVTLIVKDANGCQSVFTHPDTIKVYNKPVAAFSVSDSSICVGSSISLLNLSQSSSSYKWQLGDGSTSQHYNVNHPYQTPGQFSITLVASNGYCSDTANSINAVTVIPFPIAEFGGSPLIGCIPLSSSMVNISTSLQNPVFMWDGGNGLTSSAFNPQFNYQNAGYYSVTLKVTNEGLCSDSITKLNFIAAQNNQPITPSEISYITVLDSNAIRISWQPSSATNLNRFELYRSTDNKNYNLIYTDSNSNNSTLNQQLAYIDNNVTTNQNRYYYKILTINNCNNSYPLDSSRAHASILLTTAPDTMSNTLSWLPYIGAPISQYSIYRSIDGLNYDLIDAIAGTEDFYIDSTAYCPQEYSYKIEAQLDGSIYTSESNNDASVPTSLVNQITTSVIRSTVIDNNSILTEWYEGTPFPELVYYYLIYKSSDKNPGNFILIDSVNNSTKYYLDRDVDVNTFTYQYKIEVENICQQRTGLTDLSGNILLQGKLDDMNNSRLEWTPYKGWKEGVERYEIQKQDENGNWKTIKSVDGNTHHMEEE